MHDIDAETMAPSLETLLREAVVNPPPLLLQTGQLTCLCVCVCGYSI